MEIPVERRPEHHGDLSGGARGGLEVIARGIRNRGYEETIIVESRVTERVDVSLFLFWCIAGLRILRIGGLRMFVGVVFRLEVNGPPGGEDAGMDIEVIGFEEEAAEDGSDGQVLPIGEVYDTVGVRHACECVVIRTEEILFAFASRSCALTSKSDRTLWRGTSDDRSRAGGVHLS